MSKALLMTTAIFAMMPTSISRYDKRTKKEYVYDSDWTRVTPEIMGYLHWNGGKPYPTNDKQCVAYKGGELHSIACSGYSKDTTPLGYICEARPMDSIDQTETCHFPFEHQGNTHDSCSHDLDVIGKHNHCISLFDFYSNMQKMSSMQKYSLFMVPLSSVIICKLLIS
jgi:hypothetical protein